jgi:hypothetical protein
MAGGLVITAADDCEAGTGCLLVMRISSHVWRAPLPFRFGTSSQTTARGSRMIGKGLGHVKPELILTSLRKNL